MTYKILEALGVDNENIDGAALNWMASSGKNGILRGVLNECKFYQTTSTSAEIGTGELMIHGFRVKLTEPYAIEQPYIVPENTFSVIMGISLASDRQVSLSITCEPTRTLVQDNLFVTEQGLYEIEFGKITAGPSGITALVRTVEPIVIGSSVPSEEEDEPAAACITEYDYVISDPSEFTQANLNKMSGNVLVNCDIMLTGGQSYPEQFTIPSAVKVLNFNGHRLDVDLTAGNGTERTNCRLINAYFEVGGNWEAGYEQWVDGFGSVEFCRGAGVYSNCGRIAHSDIWRASGCDFINDVQTRPYEYEDTVFSNCRNITNVRVSDIYNDQGGVEFDGCSYISNVSFVGDRDGVVHYNDCRYVDVLTCYGYRHRYYDDDLGDVEGPSYGVPYIDANGITTFLDRAEGGSYGS